MIIPVIALGGFVVWSDRPFHSRIENVEIDYGESELFSQEELKKAVEVVLDDYQQGSYCDVLKVEYMGDDRAEHEFNYWIVEDMERNLYDYRIDGCAVFATTFKTWERLPEPSREPDTVYSNWNYVVAKKADGEWFLISQGYA